jgi:hypothetical protein
MALMVHVHENLDLARRRPAAIDRIAVDDVAVDADAVIADPLEARRLAVAAAQPREIGALALRHLGPYRIALRPERMFRRRRHGPVERPTGHLRLAGERTIQRDVLLRRAGREQAERRHCCHDLHGASPSACRPGWAAAASRRACPWPMLKRCLAAQQAVDGEIATA